MNFLFSPDHRTITEISYIQWHSSHSQNKKAGHGLKY